MAPTQLTILISVAAMIVASTIVYLIMASSRRKAIAEKDGKIADLGRELVHSEHTIELKEKEMEGMRALADEQRKNYEKTVSDIREAHSEALRRQAESLKAELTVQTEKLLKQREEELDKKAKETFDQISGSIGKDLKEMKEAFDGNRKAQTENSASMKERFESAVKSLESHTREIGAKADRLAEAMRGQKKLQGCWGETILLNLLTTEGLQQGRDFDKEETLRDELGIVILNEDSDKKMRPDFILHYPDDQDVVVDAKVSLVAFSDYLEAQTDEARQAAAVRNAEAIKEQVKRLSKKDYSTYLRPGHKMLDYVIMFVPNYPAMQLAYQTYPDLWKRAYEQKVLITTEETLMPFLRMITIAWKNVEQVRNQQKIVDAAQRMVDRVADFMALHARMGQKLKDAQAAWDESDRKLRNEGQGILVSAHQVLRLGVSSKKALPEADMADADR